MSEFFEKKYEIHTFDFDVHRAVRANTLINFLQDIATLHYTHATKNLKDDAVWVIIEWDIKFAAALKSVQTILVKTKPTYFRKFIAYRSYEILDESGELILTAVSKWAYLNQNSRRQETIPQVLYEKFKVPVDAEKPGKLEGMNFTMSSPQVKTFRSVFSDIDVNSHVNNAVYLKWAMDSLPMSHLKSNQLRGMKVVYKKEVLHGDEVNVETEIVAGESWHIIRGEQGDECVRVLMKW